MFQSIKRTLSIFTLCALLSVQIFTAIPVYAIDVPQAPTAPPAPTTSEAQSPTQPPAPTAPTAPKYGDPTPTPKPEQKAEEKKEEKKDESAQSSGTSQGTTQSSAPQANATAGSTANGSTGDVALGTGDATTTGAVTSTGNSNTSVSPLTSGSGNGTEIVNSGNGTGSTNTGSASIANSDTTVQNNSAIVGNNLDLDSTTGENSASGNVGDSKISTGDANTSGTIVTAVNTNIDGVSASEFNIMDDQVGDVILDFSANCIMGCAGGPATMKNTGNGSNSTNTADVSENTSTATFQNNDATIENSITLAADSGSNTADKNTGGDTLIQTGDANVDANVLTFANNNIAGNVVFGVVNIYGDLIGDIIFPEEAFATGGNNTTVANTGNGSGTTNAATSNQSSTDVTAQTNNATITNNLNLDGSTGANTTSKNTGGDSTVQTGEVDVNAQVLNIANSNVEGNWFLVIVNEAGQWVGKILGAPEGANYAGSPGTEFSMGPNGEVTAVNSGNGSGSDNTTNVNSQATNTTAQNNDANIVNNVNLSANTGGNSASKNTGGDSTIKTGDANIIANLVNFVNNNVAGNGKLFVTVVNVFDSWTGNFVTPWTKKEEKTQLVAQADPTPTIVPIGGITEEQEEDTPKNKEKKSSSKKQSPQSSSDAPTVANNTAAATPSYRAGSGSIHVNHGAVSLQVAGISATNLKASNDLYNVGGTAKKSVKINLAYIILVTPFLFGWVIKRRLFSKQK